MANHPRSVPYSIFRELASMRLNLDTPGFPELRRHNQHFAAKVKALDEIGFAFTRNQVLSILYQITLGDALFDQINTLLDPETPGFNFDIDLVSSLAAAHLDEAREQLQSADQPANPTHSQQGSSALPNNKTDRRKRSNDDTQTEPMKIRKTLCKDNPLQITYHLPLACQLSQERASGDEENRPTDLSFEGASEFDTPFYKYHLRSDISSIEHYNQRVADFLQWCSNCAIRVHPQITLQLDRKLGQLCVKLKPSPEEQLMMIPNDTVVASIPKAHCFTLKTSSLHTNPSLHKKFTTTTSYSSNSDSIIASIAESPVLLRLTIHLAHELSLGSQSPWFPYLNLISHPDYRLPALIHLFVDRVPELEDWFKGTEIARLMAGPDSCTLSFLKNHFQVGYPHEHIAWECFLRAFTIVSSRAFEIDRYHQLGLVPFADLFDHSDEPDVQFVSQVHVCQQCGSQRACMHCYCPDDPNYHRFLERQSQSKINCPSNDHAVELKSLRALMPPQRCQRSSLTTSTTAGENFEESTPVYNSYGELSNATLLTRYGFMISANSHDRINFDLAKVVEACVQLDVEEAQPASINDPSNTLTELSKQVGVGLQAFRDVFQSHGNNGLIGPFETDGLWIDSDSKLSPALWLSIVYQILTHESTDPPKTHDFRDIYRLQQTLHSSLKPDILALPTTDQPIDVVLRRLTGVANAVSALVSMKQNEYHLPELTIEQLLDLKEELIEREKKVEKAGREAGMDARSPESRIRIPIHQDNASECSLMGVLPVAIEYSISERLILNKTLELWEHIIDCAGNFNE